MAMMKEQLPIPAIMTPYLAGALGKNSPNIVVPSRSNVIEVIYSGDPGGIICRLDIDGPETKSAFLVSLTHLAFDRRGPPAREIEAYQRHPIKKFSLSVTRGGSFPWRTQVQHIHCRLATGQHCAKRNHQQFQRITASGVAVPRIVRTFEARRKRSLPTSRDH